MLLFYHVYHIFLVLNFSSLTLLLIIPRLFSHFTFQVDRNFVVCFYFYVLYSRKSLIKYFYQIFIHNFYVILLKKKKCKILHTWTLFFFKRYFIAISKCVFTVTLTYDETSQSICIRCLLFLLACVDSLVNLP